jgi:hypothetical protein
MYGELAHCPIPEYTKDAMCCEMRFLAFQPDNKKIGSVKCYD